MRAHHRRDRVLRQHGAAPVDARQQAQPAPAASIPAEVPAPPRRIARPRSPPGLTARPLHAGCRSGSTEPWTCSATSPAPLSSGTPDAAHQVPGGGPRRAVCRRTCCVATTMGTACWRCPMFSSSLARQPVRRASASGFGQPMNPRAHQAPYNDVAVPLTVSACLRCHGGHRAGESPAQRPRARAGHC